MKLSKDADDKMCIVSIIVVLYFWVGAITDFLITDNLFYAFPKFLIGLSLWYGFYCIHIFLRH